MTRAAAAALLACALALSGCADAGLEAAVARAEASAASARQGEVDALYGFMRKTHPALFHHNTRATIEAEVERLRARAPALSWPEWVVGVHRVLKLVGDGHTSVFPFPDAGPGFDTRLPLEVDAFGDGWFVVAGDARHRAAVGARLVAIEGKPIDAVLEELASFWPHENRMWVKRWAPMLLRRPGFLVGAGIARGRDVAAPIAFTVRLASGEERTIAAAPVPAAEDERAQPRWLRANAGAVPATPLHASDAPFGFVHLAEAHTVYAVYRQCEDAAGETVAAFAERLFAFAEANGVEKLAIDVRENGGGDEAKNAALLARMERSPLNRRGALFVLIGRRTFSAAQNFATRAERHTQALFVGEPTGSAPNHWGDAKSFTLPGSRLTAIVATKHWQDSDPADARFQLPPDLPAWQKFEDWRTGRDAALEAVLRYRAPADAMPFDPKQRWRDGRGERKRHG